MKEWSANACGLEREQAYRSDGTEQVPKTRIANQSCHVRARQANEQHVRFLIRNTILSLSAIIWSITTERLTVHMSSVFQIAVATMILIATGAFAIKGNTTARAQSCTDSIPLETAPKASELRVTFLGVSTLLFDDGETSILTDGFFTRPSVVAVATKKISPDRKIIAQSLRKAGIEKLAAVLVTHSHYDHAMDAPEVALKTGALIVGSESTANIARGWNVPENRIVVPESNKPLQFGKFEVTFIPSAHAPLVVARGIIAKPLVPPARATSYRDGGSFAILIKHDGRSLLVQSSAGIAPGALRGYGADVVFLGIGLLGKQPVAFREQYWRETVKEVGARRVVPVHWDDFSKPLDRPLVPTPWPLDDVKKALSFLHERAELEGIEVLLPSAWKQIDPLQGLR